MPSYPTYTCYGLIIVTATAMSSIAHADFLPGERVLMDAHNCYPYQSWWANRLERALGTGLPLACGALHPVSAPDDAGSGPVPCWPTRMISAIG